MKKHEFLIINLPHGIKVMLNQMGKFNLDEEYPQPHNEICDIVNILTEEPFEYEISDGKMSYGFIEENEFDLILRPLSDINKEIEHKGEKFVPSEWFELGDDDKHCLNFGNNNIKLKEELETIAKHNLINDINYLPFAVVQKLIEWHFNLMDKEEEFIDVNTLNDNPYK